MEDECPFCWSLILAKTQLHPAYRFFSCKGDNDVVEQTLLKRVDREELRKKV